MSILQMVLEQGHTSEGHGDWAVRKLAEWEDLAETGEPICLDPDELAMVRHALQELLPTRGS